MPMDVSPSELFSSIEYVAGEQLEAPSSSSARQDS